MSSYGVVFMSLLVFLCNIKLRIEPLKPEAFYMGEHIINKTCKLTTMIATIAHQTRLLDIQDRGYICNFMALKGADKKWEIIR